MRNSCEYPLVLKASGAGQQGPAGKFQPAVGQDSSLQAQEQLEQYMEEDRKRLQDESKVGGGAGTMYLPRGLVWSSLPSKSP